MRVLRVSVWDNHLSKRKSVEDWSHNTLVGICDVVENNSLLVVETNMNLPVLPINSPSLDLERDAFWLGNVNWLDICPVAALGFNAGGVVIIWFLCADRTTDFWNIDVHNLLCIRIEDRAEIEGEGVLTIVFVGAIVHEGLL